MKVKNIPLSASGSVLLKNVGYIKIISQVMHKVTSDNFYKRNDLIREGHHFFKDFLNVEECKKWF